MAEQNLEHHHVSPNGKVVVHGLKRVLPHNQGEVFGVEPEVYKALVNHKDGPAVELAVRVVMLKDAPHWKPEHNPVMAAGSHQALPAGYSKQLIADGKCALCTPEHDKKAAATRAEADAKNAEELAAATMAMMSGKAATSQTAQKSK